MEKGWRSRKKQNKPKKKKTEIGDGGNSATTTVALIDLNQFPDAHEHKKLREASDVKLL